MQEGKGTPATVVPRGGGGKGGVGYVMAPHGRGSRHPVTAAATTPPLAVHRILMAQTEMWSGTGPPLAEVTLMAVGLSEPVGVQWR